MGINYDYLILTINNRGFSSAVDLAEKGHKVAWLDMSEKTCWSSKDYSGPLPFHVRRDVDERERRVFFEPHQCEKLPQGLALMTEQGVLELGGLVSQTQMQSFRQSDDLERLQNSYGKNVSALSKDLKNHWLVHFLSAYNKSVTDEDILSPGKNLKISDVFGDTYFSVENFAHRQKNRRYLESKSIKLLEFEKFEIRYEAKSYFIKSINDEVVSASNVLCFLESSDVSKIDPEFAQQIFQEKPIESLWEWRRLDLSWQTSLDISAVPDVVILLSHWDLPWLEENFVVLRKSADSQWSLWAQLKKDQGDLSGFFDELNEILVRHIKMSEFKIATPQKIEGLKLQIFPVYQKKPELMVRKDIGFYPMGFDKTHSFDKFDMFQAEKQIVDELIRRPS